MVKLKEQYSVDEEVLLNTQNLRIEEGKSRKLTDKFVGPFKVIEIISKSAYRLGLPQSWKIHDVFHVSKLRRYNRNEQKTPKYERPPPIEVEGNLEYEVEEILDKRKRRNATEYLILWKGFPKEDATWEPLRNLNNAKNAIKIYEEGLIKGGRDVKEPTASDLAHVTGR